MIWASSRAKGLSGEFEIVDSAWSSSDGATRPRGLGDGPRHICRSISTPSAQSRAARVPSGCQEELIWNCPRASRGGALRPLVPSLSRQDARSSDMSFHIKPFDTEPRRDGLGRLPKALDMEMPTLVARGLPGHGPGLDREAEQRQSVAFGGGGTASQRPAGMLISLSLLRAIAAAVRNHLSQLHASFDGLRSHWLAGVHRSARLHCSCVAGTSSIAPLHCCIGRIDRGAAPVGDRT